MPPPKLMLGHSLAFAAWAVLSFAGCNQNGAAHDVRKPGGGTVATYAGSYPIQVVCTTGMVADLVEHVGGERVAVTALMGAGVDPHLYKATTGDVEKMDKADMIFYSGLHLEGKMADIFVQMARRGRPTYAVTEAIDPERVIEVADGAYDPHLWFDVALWGEAVDVVRQALAEFDPTHAAEYGERAKKYRADLAALDEECRQKLATVPRDQRVLVTAHDAFSYFGRAYDVEVRGIQGVSTDAEAGVREINQLVEFMVSRKIKAVFAETSVSDRNVQALTEGCRARGHDVVLGGRLFSDAMGAPGTPEGTYMGMVRHNVSTIVQALK